MKIRFVTFAIAKYGGIIAHIEAKFQAFKEMGYDVDIIILDYLKNIPEKQYETKLKKLESGDFQESLDIKSQNGGYIKSSVSGYWYNPYYGWLLKPNKNRIAVFGENSLEIWKKETSDVDLLIWSFVPTKTSEAKGFNYWHKFFELPDSVFQILSVHDGYYDIRNSWTNLLKNKIKVLECVHITSYKACKVFDIPRLLNLDSRYIKNKKFLSKNKKSVDFFAAHIFKSMKRMEDLVSSIPYLNPSSVLVAGSGIELYYMMTENEDKQKTKYTVNLKTDPDRSPEEEGVSLWSRAEKYGMEYLGLIDNETTNEILYNSKFAIDPSFSTHYAKYINTHLNGFIIEAIINGCVPILRNYRKDILKDDIIFENLEAIYIPYDSTPKEFAGYLNKALDLSELEYERMVNKNLQLAKQILNPIVNMKSLINLLQNKNLQGLSYGESTIKIKDEGMKVMKNHFKYENIPNWMID